MEPTKYIWMDGKWTAWDDARVHVLTHALHYGSGVFEGIRAYRTPNGPAIFQLRPHVDRLFQSASAIAMKVPFSKDEVAKVCVEVVARNGLEQAYVRPLIYYGYGTMGVSPRQSPVQVMVACWEWGAYLPHELVDVKISRFCRLDPRTIVAEAKVSGHYINSLMAVLDARSEKYHEALLLDTDGNLAEGPGENIFIVKDGTILTPALGSILAGITRKTVFRMAADLGFKVVEKTIRPEEAFAADEAFFTGTATEIAPIRSIDDHLIGNGNVGPITTKVRATYLDAVYGRDARYADLLTPVAAAD
jgi:branched-chain amino acid aminotransferase